MTGCYEDEIQTDWMLKPYGLSIENVEGSNQKLYRKRLVRRPVVVEDES
jgi:hypothetical protein